MELLLLEIFKELGLNKSDNKRLRFMRLKDEIILLHVKCRQAYATKYNLDACLIVIGHRLDIDELYNICHPNMYMKHGL